MLFASRLSAGTLLLALGSLALLSRPVHAQGLVLDQSNVVSSANAQDDYGITGTTFIQSLAETFTVGVAGKLSQVGFQVYHNTNATGALIFQILSTSGGNPNPDSIAPLFQTTVPLASTPTINSPEVPFTLIDVSAAGIIVTPGQVLTIALKNPTGSAIPPWTLWRSGPATYTGGALYIQQQSDAPNWRALVNNGTVQDLGFQTFVTAAVPEPGSVALLVGMGVSGAGFLARRRKQVRKAA